MKSPHQSYLSDIKCGHFFFKMSEQALKPFNFYKERLEAIEERSEASLDRVQKALTSLQVLPLKEKGFKKEETILKNTQHSSIFRLIQSQTFPSIFSFLGNITFEMFFTLLQTINLFFSLLTSPLSQDSMSANPKRKKTSKRKHSKKIKKTKL